MQNRLVNKVIKYGDQSVVRFENTFWEWIAQKAHMKLR